MNDLTKEDLHKLKLKACEYMESLSEVRNVDFNAGQAMGIKLMFKWIEGLQNE